MASTDSRSVRVAVIQDAPVVFELEPTLAKVAELSDRAAADGAQLAVFPEAFVGGYPKGMDFGAVIGSRTDEGREQFRRYWAGAIDVPGPATTRLGQAAADAGLHLVMGVIERDGGTLYCSALYFAPDGTLLGKHRKLMPTAMERLVWGFGDGSTMPVIDTPLGRIGAVICWENYMPLMRAAMYAKGIELYCAPTADDREMWQATVRHIAREGRCFVLSACQFLCRSDCPDDYPVDAAPDTVLMGGGSCIVAPTGELLAGPVRDGRCVLVADLDLGDIPRNTFDFDAVGHYARPDIFQLHVDERPKPPVVGGAG
jgi:nitrilase